MTDTAEPRCPLCHEDGGAPLYRDERLRIVLVDDADHPGFLRVIWAAHVKEMTDLSEADRAHCMAAVFAAETALREVLQPDKINLASFGNMVPHVHWHVIPRFADDAHFPNAVWGGRRRVAARALPDGFRESVTAQLTRLL
jgi:diadenosine tetraphosphate (Ap4A) HIT family hydrolase